MDDFKNLKNYNPPVFRVIKGRWCGDLEKKATSEVTDGAVNAGEAGAVYE